MIDRATLIATARMLQAAGYVPTSREIEIVADMSWRQRIIGRYGRPLGIRSAPVQIPIWAWGMPAALYYMYIAAAQLGAK